MNMKLPAYLQDEVENLVPFGNEDLDFSEFEWMADQELEEFDRQVEEEYWEGEFIEACFEEMLQEEEEREMIFFSSSYPDHSHSTMDSHNKVFSSKLNPDAPEFVPTTHKKGKAQPSSLVQNNYIIQTWVAFNCIEPCLSFMERKNLQKNDNTPNILVYLGDWRQLVVIFVLCTFPMTCFYVYISPFEGQCLLTLVYHNYEYIFLPLF